jgi:hypothetical protein
LIRWWGWKKRRKPSKMRNKYDGATMSRTCCSFFLYTLIYNHMNRIKEKICFCTFVLKCMFDKVLYIIIIIINVCYLLQTLGLLAVWWVCGALPVIWLQCNMVTLYALEQKKTLSAIISLHNKKYKEITHLSPTSKCEYKFLCIFVFNSFSSFFMCIYYIIYFILFYMSFYANNKNGININIIWRTGKIWDIWYEKEKKNLIFLLLWYNHK